MAFRDWLTRKLSKTVEAAVEPVKQTIIEAKNGAANKAGLLANGLRVLTCVVIGWLLMRDNGNSNGYYAAPAQKQEPNNIVINNYINKEVDK